MITGFVMAAILVVILATFIMAKSEDCIVSWKINNEPITPGGDVELLCKYGNSKVCPGTPRWEGGPEMQILSVEDTVFETNKYEVSVGIQTYKLIIKQATREELNSTFICHVRFVNYAAWLPSKMPKYSLQNQDNRKLDLGSEVTLYTDVAKVPFNKPMRPFWSRHPIQNNAVEENIIDSENIRTSIDGSKMVLQIKNLTESDVDMTYKLSCSGVIFERNLTINRPMTTEATMKEQMTTHMELYTAEMLDEPETNFEDDLDSGSDDFKKPTNLLAILGVSAFVVVILLSAIVLAVKYWRNSNREFQMITTTKDDDHEIETV